MKKLIYLLFIFVSIYSCEMYPEPGSQTIESFSFYIIGKQQTAEAGEYLADEVGVQINLESLYPKNDKKFHMVLDIKSGNGTVDKSIVEADTQGLMLTRWKLGNENNNQIITGKIYDSSDQFFSEIEIQATAFFMDKLNTIKTGHLVGIEDMLCDTTRQRSMMFNEGQFWILKDKFYSWEYKEWNYNTNIRMIDMTSDGTVFAAGWNGALYKTEDWGNTWQYVCNPFPDNKYYYNFNITGDDYLWASKNSYGLYCSKDKGLTWTQDTTERVKNTTLGPIYKYSNSYLAIAGNPLSIIQKYADSLTWHNINTPEYSLSMYVPNDTTIIAQNQGGYVLHKSTDGGVSYKRVFAPNTTMGGGDLWHVYNKFGNNYFVLAPSSGVWRTRDFEKFEQLIKIETYQQKLFIDHLGTIYAAGSNFVNAEDEATYILPRIQ